MNLGPFGPFCPVALHTEGKIRRGNAMQAVVFLGQVYLLSSPAARRVFMANPKAYVRKPKAVPCRLLICGFDGDKADLLANAFLSSHSLSDTIGIYELENFKASHDDSEDEKKQAIRSLIHALSQQQVR